MLKLLVLLTVIALALGAPRGKADVDGKIVGGSTVNIADYPYTLSLQSSNRHFCGAALISNTIVLTAAHCLIPGGYVLAYLSVRAGASAWASGGQSALISRVHNHEEYRSSSYDFDISVVFLSFPITVGNSRVIELAPLSFNPAVGTLTTLTGWGVLYEGSNSAAANLQMVQVPLVSHASCVEVYGSDITSNMWCAGFANGGRDTCQGDSGGPAVIQDLLAGLVSFGEGCARAGFPGVYASIPAFRTWIYNVCGI